MKLFFTNKCHPTITTVQNQVDATKSDLNYDQISDQR